MGLWGAMKHTNFNALLQKMPAELRKKFDAMSFEMVDEAAKRFVHTVGLRFKSGDWLNDYLPPQVLLDGDVSKFAMHDPMHDTTHFTPFVEKIRVPQGSKICIIGDVHGDLGYLVEVLAELQRLGYLDEDYRLIDPTVYIAFAGDYTNRNHHSVEVMLTLFYLYRHNLGRVFLLRGNHEYAISVRVVYEMYQAVISDRSDEPSRNSHGLKDSFIAEMSRKFSLYRFPDLLYWFDFLPMGLYVGCYDDKANQFDYLNVCHGGIEPGYSSAAFLASEARFERFKALDRYKAMEQLIADNVIPNAKNRLKFVFDSLTKRGLTQFAASFVEDGHIVNLEHRHNPRQLRLGMQWNSFLTESNENIAIASSHNHRNILFGQDLTNYFFAQASAPGHQIVSMVRGHQHLDDADAPMGLNSPMLNQLREQQGIVRQWDGAVYTMGDGGSATGWQSFLIVTTGKSLPEWQSTHYFRKDIEAPFEQKTTVFVVR